MLEKRFRIEAASAILNKIGQFAASPRVRAIIGQETPKFDLTFAMDNRRIVIFNIAKGVIGERAASVLGSLFISQIELLALSRSQVAPEKRVPFHLHIDELQNFGTDSTAVLLSERRRGTVARQRPRFAPTKGIRRRMV